MLLDQAIAAFGPVKRLDANLHLPLYDGDLEEAEGIPTEVQTLADQIAAADAIIISSPEYNKGISGVLKNALDWISRVEGSVLTGKPVMVLAAAAGRTGGETARYMTLNCLIPLQARLIPGAVVQIAGAGSAFDEDRKLLSPHNQEALAVTMLVLRKEISWYPS